MRSASGRWARAATPPFWAFISIIPCGHGFTPVAVCFNCWINRRTRARLYGDGRIERLE
jgi:tartrate dehydratase alpha subunit/fumarate hydratase class I-like protein